MTDRRRARLGIALAIGLVLVVQLLVTLRYRPPAAAALEAPPERFSAQRAQAALARVLGDGSAHPVGSLANARVRENLEHELRELGLTPELQRGSVCSRFGTCAEPVNVIARLRGREPGPPILLAAHYDSVPAGAGAADDGAGVATLLEVARILVREPPRRPVILLFDDGEELGLLGAELFVRQFRELDQITAAINVEARGTSGPSLLFETTRGSARFARLAASSLRRPVTTSLAVAVYRRLPNDTDLTVLSRHGVAGANFGFIADVAHYHTPLDDLAHLDLGSLQHHGDNVLALARALDAGDDRGAGRDAVWFDVLALGVVWWPLEHTWSLLAVIFALFAGAGAIAARRVTLRVADVVRALVAPAAVIGLAGVLALGFDWLAAVPSPWIAHPLPTLIAAWALALAALLAGSLAAGTTPKPAAHWATTWLTWLLLCALLASRMPEGSYLVLVPAGVAAIFALLRALLGPGLDGLALFAPFVAALLVWLPIVQLLLDAIGYFTLAPYPIAIAIALLPLSPLAALLGARARLFGAAFAIAIALAAVGVGALLPTFSAQVPQRVTFALHHDADAKTSRWLVDSPFGRVPHAVMTAGAFSPEHVPAHPWLGSLANQVHAAPAADPAPPAAPVLENVVRDSAGGGQRVRARLRSLRGADLLAILVPEASTIGVRIAGHPVVPRRVSGHDVYIWGGTTAGVDVELQLTGTGPHEILLVDHAYGLPPAGRFLLDARPASAVASQLGDVTVVSRRTRL